MESYLMCHDLWNVTCGDCVALSEESAEKAKWNIIAGGALFKIKHLVDDGMFEHVYRRCEEPKGDLRCLCKSFCETKYPLIAVVGEGNWKFDRRKIIYLEVFPENEDCMTGVVCIKSRK